VISGSVSGVADCSVLVRCDAVPGASKGHVSSIYKGKQSHWTALNACHMMRVSRWCSI